MSGSISKEMILKVNLVKYVREFDDGRKGDRIEEAFLAEGTIIFKGR